MAKGTAGYRIRTITCAGCGEESIGHFRPEARYCSRSCYRSAPRLSRRTGTWRDCRQCGKSFYIRACRVAKGEGHFCSLACHNLNQGRGKSLHTCKTCGETFRWSPSRTASGNYNITYCSLRCRDADPDRAAQLRQMNAIQQLRRTTKCERIGYQLLADLGLAYEPQAMFADKFCVDALLPAHRTVVQFDGDYWHDRNSGSTEPRIRRRVALDHSQDAYMRAAGWRVVRLWESDLRRDPDGCRGRIRQHLRLP